MYDLLYVILTRDISCLTVATVHFTSAQVALIFLLCGFLLLSLTSVILVFCGLQDFFCHWEICWIGVGAQTLHQKKYPFFVKCLHCEIFTLVCGFTLEIGCGTMKYCSRHSLLSGRVCSPVLAITTLPFLLLSEAAWGAQRDFSPPLVLCHPWGSSFSSHSKNGCSCSCVHSWCTWECLHSKWASNTDLHSLREVVLLPSSHALTLELPACVWHALRVMIDGSQGGCLDLKLFDWNCWEKRYVELSRIFLGNWVNSIQKPLRGNKCGTTQCHLSKATLQSTLHIQPPSSAVCTFHWLRNVCNVAILFKSLQTSLIKEAELHRVLSSCFGDRAGAFPLEVTFKGTKVHLFFISTAQLKHFTLSWV